MYWALALLSLSLAAAPATTPAKPVATKTKAPVKATPKAASNKAPISNKAAINKAPVRPVAKTPIKPLAGHTGTTAARTATPAPVRGRAQQQAQYSRYANTSRNRRQVATNRYPARQARPAYHPAPMQPTSDRYREIQASLVQKGYLAGEPSGTWDADSVAAMKRFQKDQNLDADGKLSALSLIALGLGPKHTLTANNAVVPASIPVTPKN